MSSDLTAAGAGGARRGGQDERARAYDASLKLLGARARSRAELSERLARKGFDAGAVRTLLDDLERCGLIDDADFAEQWVHFRHRDGARSRRALRVELQNKGVDDERIAAALDRISEADERARAAELVRRTVARRSLPAADDVNACRREQRRLLGMLARKGYSSEVAFAAVNQEWAAALPEAPVDEEWIG